MGYSPIFNHVDHNILYQINQKSIQNYQNF